jgi:hypothetical protein
MRILLALAGLVVVAGCSFGGQRSEVRTSDGYCALGGPWSTSPDADWVRKIAKAGGYNVFSQTPSALVASQEGHRFYIWASDSPKPSQMPNAQRLATVRGVPIYGDRNHWRYWRAQGFNFWVQLQVPGVPAAGRLAPVVDASLRLPFRDPCVARSAQA